MILFAFHAVGDGTHFHRDLARSGPRYACVAGATLEQAFATPRIMHEDLGQTRAPPRPARRCGCRSLNGYSADVARHSRAAPGAAWPATARAGAAATVLARFPGAAERDWAGTVRQASDRAFGRRTPQLRARDRDPAVAGRPAGRPCAGRRQHGRWPGFPCLRPYPRAEPARVRPLAGGPRSCSGARTGQGTGGLDRGAAPTRRRPSQPVA